MCEENREKSESEEDDDDLQLAPLEEDDGPGESISDFLELAEPEETLGLTPLIDPEPETPGDVDEEEDEGDEDEEEDPPPPRLEPFEAIRFLAWPLRGGRADELVISVFVLFIVLLGGWVLGLIPAVGWALRILVILCAGVYYFTFPVKAARCAAEGRPAPSVWLHPSLGDEGYGSGVKLGVLLLLYGLPAGLLARATNEVWASFPLAILAWGLVPAALMNLAASGSMLTANPVDAFRLALSGRWLYVRIAVPGAVFILTRYIVGGSFNAVWVGVLGWAVLVYTAEGVGLLTVEREEVRDRLFAITGLSRDASEDETEEPPPPETPEDPETAPESS